MRNICKKYKITTERADLFDVNMTVGLSVNVRGAANEQQIRSAFETAVSCHEILCTRVVIEEDGSAYYVEIPKKDRGVCDAENLEKDGNACDAENSEKDGNACDAENSEKDGNACDPNQVFFSNRELSAI